MIAGEMPDVRWFEGARLNYVDRLLRHRTSSQPAIVDVAETGGDGADFTHTSLSWTELIREIGAFARFLRERGRGR